MTERCRARGLGPFDDASRDPVCHALRLFARALVAREEEHGAPLLRAHAAHVCPAPLAHRGPMVGKRAAALEDDVGRIERLVEQRWDRSLEPCCRAEVAGAVPDEAAVVAIDREPGTNTNVDGEKRRHRSARVRHVRDARTSHISEACMAERRTDQDSADQKAHGTHGRGRGNEQRVDDANVEPDHSKGTEREGGRGTAGWGSEGSGGSVIDKRDKS